MEAKLGREADKDTYKWDLCKDLEQKGLDPVDLKVEELRVGPNGVPVDTKLELEMLFSLGRSVRRASWRVHFEVDTVHARHRIELGETPVVDLDEGYNDVFFFVDSIKVEDVEPSALTNAGILSAVLVEGEDEVAAVNMLVQMQAHGEELLRTIYSPLE